MKSFVKKLATVVVVLVIPAVALGQADKFGKPDTVYVELSRIDQQNWSITVSVTNDEWLQALALPFELHSGKVKVVGDSAVYTGGRVEQFAFKGFRADTSIQCVTMGLLANMGPTYNVLSPGNGRLVTFFVSSLDNSPVEKLSLDTTTTHPNNSLMMIANSIQYSEPPDTIPSDRAPDLNIVPVFVVKQAQ